MFRNKKYKTEVPHPQVSPDQAFEQLSLREVVDRYALISKNGALALMTVKATYRPTDPKGHTIDLRYGKNNPIRHFIIELPDGSMNHTIVDERNGKYTERWTKPGEVDATGRPILHESEKAGDFQGYNRNSSVYIHVPKGAIAKEFSADTQYIEEDNTGLPVITADHIAAIKQAGLYDEFTLAERMFELENGVSTFKSPQIMQEHVSHLAGHIALG